jgi:hypothetical protein
MDTGRVQEDKVEWVVVKEWSGGHGRMTTDVFTPGSRPWRVSFKATTGERWGLLDVFVRSKDGKPVGSAVNMHLMAFEDGQRSGSLLIDAADTEYVLDIASDNLSWQVVAERRK